MHEELREYEEAILAGDLPKAADALIDLAYVVLGTAHLHHLPWDALFHEVQNANMAKERCDLHHPFQPSIVASVETCAYVMNARDPRPGTICGAPRHKHSLRGNINDVIKPPGWQPPNIAAVLRRFGWECDGNHGGAPCGPECWNYVSSDSSFE